MIDIDDISEKKAKKILDWLAKRAGYVQYAFYRFSTTDKRQELTFVNSEGEHEIVHPLGRSSMFGYSVPIEWDEKRIVEDMFKNAKEQRLVVWDNHEGIYMKKVRVIEDADTLESVLIDIDLFGDRMNGNEKE